MRRGMWARGQIKINFEPRLFAVMLGPQHDNWAAFAVTLQQIPRAAHRPLHDTINMRPTPPFRETNHRRKIHVVLEELAHLSPKRGGSDNGRQFAVIFDAAVFEIG